MSFYLYYVPSTAFTEGAAKPGERARPQWGYQPGPPQPSATPQGGRAPLQHEAAVWDDLEKPAQERAPSHTEAPTISFLLFSITELLETLRKQKMNHFPSYLRLVASPWKVRPNKSMTFKEVVPIPNEFLHLTITMCYELMILIMA